jgi:hypothetical protein
MQESLRHDEKPVYVLALQEHFVFVSIFYTIQIFTNTV